MSFSFPVLVLHGLSHQYLYKLYQICPENGLKGSECIRIVKIVLCRDDFLCVCPCVWNLSSAPLGTIGLLCLLIDPEIYCFFKKGSVLIHRAHGHIRG